MPWCEECARYLVPSAMGDDGTCPSCGRAPSAGSSLTAGTLDLKAIVGDDDSRAPWHFRLLVAMLIAYLGWRVVDLFI